MLQKRRRFKKSGQLNWIASEASERNLKTKLQPQEFYVKEIDAGRQVGTYQGIPIEVDDFMPATGANTATNKWGFLLLDWEDIRLVAFKGNCLDWTPWADVDGTAGVQASLCSIHGQLIVDLMASHILIVNSDTY